MAKQTQVWDTLIVGGGVIGLSLAWELADRGRQVCVVDSQALGGGSSWAGAGILPPTALKSTDDPYEQLRSLSSRRHAWWAEVLKQETEIDTGYRACGGIYLGRSVGEKATLLANQLWWEEHGIPYEQLTAAQLQEIEPSLNHDLLAETKAGAWWLPTECQIRNPHYLQALVAACRIRSVQLQEDLPIREMLVHSGGIQGVIAENGEQILARQVCLTSGAWTRLLLDRLGLPNGLMPVRGQIVLFRTETPLLERVVNEGNRYLVPRLDGRLLAGSVEEEVGYECKTTPEAIRQIQGWAEQLLPGLAGRVEKTWAGLRPGSFDGLPYLGHVPGIDELYIATGHFRSGLHLSAGTAVVMADLMCGQSPTIDLTSFRLGRG